MGITLNIVLGLESEKSDLEPGCIIMKEGPLGLVMLMLGLMWNPSYEASHNEEEAANMADVDHPEIFKQSTHISVGLGSRKRYSRYLNILKTLFKFSTEL